MSTVKDRRSAPKIERAPTITRDVNHWIYDNSIHICRGSIGRKSHAYWIEQDAEGIYVPGERLCPGVTTILRRLDKPALITWAAGAAAGYVEDYYREGMSRDELSALCGEAAGAHRRISRAAADKGTMVHGYAEQILRQRIARKDERVLLPKDADQAVVNACMAFEHWLDEHDVTPFEGGLERPVYSKRWHFAGTADFFGMVDGLLVVGDFKTSKGVYLEHKLQLAAYGIAIEEELDKAINGRLIVRFSKETGEFEVHLMSRDKTAEDAFLRCHEMHQLLNKMEAA
jgi:hypothetical protein